MNESTKTQLSTTTKWNSYEEMKAFRIQDYLQRPNNAHSFMIIELDHLWDLLQEAKEEKLIYPTDSPPLS